MLSESNDTVCLSRRTSLFAILSMVDTLASVLKTLWQERSESI